MVHFVLLCIMKTIDDIFAAFGGPAAVGRAIGKSTEHAASMRRRRSIPVAYWPALIQRAAERGIRLTAEMLVEMHARVPSRKGAA